MATGISICKKCTKEFKWYRNKEQGPAKYCSKKCKDESHGDWCKKTTRTTQFFCEECGKEFKRYTAKGNKLPRFCSGKCLGKNVHTWTWNSKRFQWSTATEEERLERLKMNFEKHVIRKEGCWDWKGTIGSKGYAPMIIGEGYTQTGAHRISWMIHNGTIPEGMNILHKCDNRKCTNPDHLFLGTHKENMLDRDKKGRSATSKLKEEEVREIKNFLKSGVTAPFLARKYKVSNNTIYAIKVGKSWGHIK